MRRASLAALFGYACSASHLGHGGGGPADLDASVARDGGASRDADPEGGAGCVVPDADGDGHASIACGGDDCNDDDAAIHPGAEDLRGGWWAERVGPVGDPWGGAALGMGPDGWPRIAYCVGPGAEVSSGFRYAAKLDGAWTYRDWYEADACEGPSLFLVGDGSFKASFTAQSAEWSDDWAWYMADGGDVPAPPSYGAYASEWAWGVGRTDDAAGARGSTSLVRQESTEEVAFHDEASGALLVRNIWPGEAANQVVDATCATTAGVSAVADPDGVLHAAYVACLDGEGRGELRHARRDGSVWSVETLEAGGVTGSAIVVDAAGAVHVAYAHGADLAHATDASGAWALEVVDAGSSPSGVSLAIGRDGTLHVAFVSGGSLRHVWLDAGGWSTERIALADAGTSIAVGPDGTPAIAYRAGDELWYANGDGDMDCDGAPD